MKSIFTVFLLLFVYSLSHSQSILTVSSNSSIPAQYNDLQSAIDNASNGDIIYLHPSPNVYNGELNKQVSIIGGGFLNDYRGDFQNLETRINRLTVNGQADNSKIANCYITRLTLSNDASNDVSFQNVLFEFSYINRIDINSSNNKFISSNLSFRNNIIGITNFNDWEEIDNQAEIFFDNNIIGIVSNGSGNNIVLRNNLFTPEDFGRAALVNIDGFTLFNNIFFGNNTRNRIGINNTSNCIFSNNLAYQTSDSFSGGSGNNYDSNINNEDPQFVEVFSDYSSLTDIMRTDFSLEAGSPAIGAGVSGTDIGVLGGAYPFYHQNRYAFPFISSIQISNPVVGEGEQLRFTIQAGTSDEN